MSSCKSSQHADNTPLVVYEVPEVYFPKFPAPAEGVLVPLDKDFHAVKDVETNIDFVVMPYWYFQLILQYVEGTETAIKALYSTTETDEK